MSRASFGTFFTLSNRGRLPLVRTEEARWRALRRLTHAGGSSLLLFAFADDHLHLVLRDIDGAARHRLARIEQSLQEELLPRLDDRDSKQIYTRSYLHNLVRYHCVQGEHHNLPGGIAWSGGCLLDLLGVRRLPGFDPSWMPELLPRLDRRALLDLVGVTLPAFSLDHVVAPERLVWAGSALIARDIRVGRSQEVVAVRRTVLELARDATGEVVTTAEALGISERSARRILQNPPQPHLRSALGELLASQATQRPPHGSS